jgi:hypothetical protein
MNFGLEAYAGSLIGIASLERRVEWRAPRLSGIIAVPMREIIPGKLWLGNAADGRDPARLWEAGIVAVISLAVEEPSPVLPRTMTYCHFPILDGEQECDGVLAVAIQTLVSLLRNQVPVLVHCGAGMSRSPAVMAAALAIVEGGNPEDRLRQIVLGHPHDVSPQLWETVRRICGQ